MKRHLCLVYLARGCYRFCTRIVALRRLVKRHSGESTWPRPARSERCDWRVRTALPTKAPRRRVCVNPGMWRNSPRVPEGETSRSYTNRPDFVREDAQLRGVAGESEPLSVVSQSEVIPEFVPVAPRVEANFRNDALTASLSSRHLKL